MPTNKSENYIESVWYKKEMTRDQLENLIGYIAQHYVIININEKESLSFSNSDIVINAKTNTMKLRLKKTEKDLKTPRTFKVLIKETKELINKSFEEIVNILTNELHFNEDQFDLNTKLEMFEKNKADRA